MPPRKDASASFSAAGPFKRARVEEAGDGSHGGGAGVDDDDLEEAKVRRSPVLGLLPGSPS